MSSSTFHPLERGQITGAAVVNCFAVFSACAVAWVIIRIVYLSLRRVFTQGDGASPREYVFFHTQLGHYAACLLLGNLCSSIAGLIGLKWLIEKGITDGPLCTAQGVIMQIGNFSTAYFTIVIAVHTFLSLVLHKRQSLIVCGIFMIFGWIATATVALSPLYYRQPVGPLYGTSGLACGIRAVYPKEQFLFHLLPIFTASVFSAILYSLIFLVLRGTLVIRGGLRLNLGPQTVSGGLYESEGYHRFIAAVARSMLWYPFAYIMLLVPYSVTRLLSLSGFIVSFAAIALAFTFWFLLGLANVLLLYNTFRVLGPAFDLRVSSHGRDMESFGTGSDFRSYGARSALGFTSEQPMTYRHPQQPSLPKLDVNRTRVPPDYRPQQSSRYSVQSGASSIGLLIPKSDAKHSPSTDSLSIPPTLDRAISPISELNREIVVTPEPSFQQTSPSSLQPPSGHSRFGSTDTLNSLPAPPRRTRSPISRKPSLDSIHDSNDRKHAAEMEANVELESRIPSGNLTPVIVSRTALYQGSNRPPASTHPSLRSSSPTELEISQWLARQHSGSMPRNSFGARSSVLSTSSPRVTGHLQLSAVASQTSFPSPTFSYYHGAGSPMSSSSPRPLPPLPMSADSPPEYSEDAWHTGDNIDPPGKNEPLIGSPPAGKFRMIVQKPSVSAFGVSDTGKQTQQGSSGHARKPSNTQPF